MSRASLDVAEFPGRLVLVTEATPAAVRDIIHAIPISAGWFSSRSYRDSYGLFASAPVRVGVDIEKIDESVTSDAILTPLETRRPAEPAEWCAWWSAKEALAKALGNAKNYDPRRLESPALWPDLQVGRWRTQQLSVPAGYVAWIVWEQQPNYTPRSDSERLGTSTSELVRLNTGRPGRC